jgi:inorganic phosphate transporter, PiT family
MDFLGNLSPGLVILLFLALFVAFAFEFVNGFHDTANAVATVIYTQAMPAKFAVIWSGFFNFLGVVTSGIAVAYSIVYLLPVDLLIESSSGAGLAMVLSLLLSAIAWNLGTWYFGIPASSSHTLIGSILGVGLIYGVFANRPFGSGVNWSKATEIGLSLLLSPMFGFCLAAGLLLLTKRLVRAPKLYQPPEKDAPPPWWIRGVLIFTCTGVSFGHGSNDGQKGMGLIMLILIGVIPAHFALNSHQTPEQVAKVHQAAIELRDRFESREDIDPKVQTALKLVCAKLQGKQDYRELPEEERLEVRNALLQLQSGLKSLLPQLNLNPEETIKVTTAMKSLKTPIEYVPLWVVLGVALALGVGTTVGWKRIVVTVGEKIGKTHLTYAQGACAEVTAMSTILAADIGGLPVSTTQVLSSGVAGTMAANGSGINMDTIKKIVLAWVLTLPVTMCLSAIFFSIARLFTG